MGHPAPKRRPIPSALAALPPHLSAEILHGELRVQPRPAPRYARIASRLGMLLGAPFDLGQSGPGGWHMLDAPEVHVSDPITFGAMDILVPDVAGYRCERLPVLPEVPYLSLAPDWICEVLSPSTERADRDEKMPIYARAGVRLAWLVDPVAQSLEVYALLDGRRWSKPTVYTGAARVRVQPFGAVEIDLGLLFSR